MISMERPTVGYHAQDEGAQHHRDGRRQDDRDRVREGGVDRLLAGVVEPEDRQQAVEERHDERRRPHGVVPHLEEGLVGRQYDALQQGLPVQARADGAGRRGGAGPVGLALVVRVVADRERLGVARVVGRVGVVRGVAPLRAALAVAAVTEVLRLAVTAAVTAAVADAAVVRLWPR
jgi:hypothetical protein